MPKTAVETDEVDSLLSLLGEQVELLVSLRALTQEQARLVDDEQSHDLLGVLGQRQQLINQLDTLNVDLGPFCARWSVWWQTLDSASRQRITPVVQQTQQLLAAIIEADERDREKLQAAQGRIAAELGRVHHTGAARKAYHAAAPGHSNRFTDQRG